MKVESGKQTLKYKFILNFVLAVSCLIKIYNIEMSSAILSFFVTVGRGTESFAACEIKDRLISTFQSSASQAQAEAEAQQTEIVSFVDFVQVRDGKILFQIPVNTEESYLEKILSLKCVERAFVAITDYENAAKGKREFLNKLMETMSSKQNYGTAIKVLDQLSVLLHERKMRNTELHKPTILHEPPNKKAKLDESTQNDESLTTEQHQEPSYQMKEVSESDKNVNYEKEVFNTFRLSARCSGKAGRWINVKKLSKDLSWRVSKASGWIVDLRKADFEICLHISDSHITAGIPLTSKPLSRRPFILDPGLRAPVAWIMVYLAEIKPGDVILDPMCGKGTLLLEACSYIKEALYVGVDLDISQLQVAQQNVTSAGSFHEYINLFLADGLCLPLKPASVDKVMCDAPFNQKHFTSKRPDEFYVSLLQEMYRVLRKCGRFILLTSQELSNLVIPLLQTTASPIPSSKSSEEPDLDSSLSAGNNLNDKFSFQLESKHYMKLGETHGEIIVMIKL